MFYLVDLSSIWGVITNINHCSSNWRIICVSDHKIYIFKSSYAYCTKKTTIVKDQNTLLTFENQTLFLFFFFLERLMTFTFREKEWNNQTLEINDCTHNIKIKTNTKFKFNNQISPK